MMNYKRLSEVLKSTANLIEDFGTNLDFDDIEEKMLDVAQECGAVVIVQGGE